MWLVRRAVGHQDCSGLSRKETRPDLGSASQSCKCLSFPPSFQHVSLFWVLCCFVYLNHLTACFFPIHLSLVNLCFGIVSVVQLPTCQTLSLFLRLHPASPQAPVKSRKTTEKIKEVRSACQDKRSMLSILEQPRPRAGSKRTGFNALLDAPSSPYVNISNARYYTPRSLSLPTPSPSPSRLPSVSPASSSSMLSVRSHPDTLDALFRHPQQRSQGSVVLKPSSSPLFETFSSDELPCANAPPSFEFTYDDEQPEPAPPYPAPESENNTSASAAFNAFRVTKSRVLRVSFPPCYSCLLSFPLFTPYLRPLASCVV